MTSLLSLKGQYVGKRVFVVGNGPSLSKTPLDRLQGEYSIAMNRISLVYSRTKWRPDFFVCTTANIKNPDWRHDIMRTIDSSITTFAWDQLEEYIGERDNVYYLHCTNGEEITDSPPLDWWSDDISERVSKYGTSMLVALQVVFYLGFAEIYVIGADLGFTDTFMQRLFSNRRVRRVLKLVGLSEKERQDLIHRFDRNHFSPGYGTPGLSSKMLNRNMTAAHRLTKSIAEQRGVKIFNATLGGKLEVYPRVDFFEVTKP
jgi:hypothetical protein